VNHLDDRSQLDGAAPPVIEKFGRQQQQHGTNALAAAATQILANLRDGFDARDRVSPELALDGGEIPAK
jgi:hypothetical protein